MAEPAKPIVAVDLFRQAFELPCSRCQSKNRVPVRRLADKPVCGHCRHALRVASPVDLDDQSFDVVIDNSALPVLVDCWAPWCAPCRMVAPELTWIARQHAEKIIVAKVNTEENPTVARQYGIRSIPTLMLFSAGQLVKRQAGALNRHQIEAAFL